MFWPLDGQLQRKDLLGRRLAALQRLEVVLALSGIWSSVNAAAVGVLQG
jgi:hypothetical protein